MTPITSKTIPSPAQWLTEILGAVGSGHKDRAGLLGRLVDHGYHYYHCEVAINSVLEEMVTTGRLERVEIPSHYDPKQTWTAWRLPGSVPTEAAVKKSLTTQNDTKPLPAGHISASTFKNAARKRR